MGSSSASTFYREKLSMYDNVWQPPNELMNCLKCGALLPFGQHNTEHNEKVADIITYAVAIRTNSQISLIWSWSVFRENETNKRKVQQLQAKLEQSGMTEQSALGKLQECMRMLEQSQFDRNEVSSRRLSPRYRMDHRLSSRLQWNVTRFRWNWLKRKNGWRNWSMRWTRKSLKRDKTPIVCAKNDWRRMPRRWIAEANMTFTMIVHLGPTNRRAMYTIWVDDRSIGSRKNVIGSWSRSMEESHSTARIRSQSGTSTTRRSLLSR